MYNLDHRSPNILWQYGVIVGWFAVLTLKSNGQ